MKKAAFLYDRALAVLAALALLSLTLLPGELHAQNQQAQPPSFDVVRVGPDGFAVMAGRAPAGSDVLVLDAEQIISRVRANRSGEWAIITDTPLEPGDRQLNLQAKMPDGAVLEASELLIVSVPDRGLAGSGPAAGATMALLLSKKPGGVSRLLQRPEAEKGLSEVELLLSRMEYEDSGAILLAGYARANGAVRIYLDNEHLGDADVDDKGGWEFDALIQSNMDGKHDLRLDEVNDSGEVEARIQLAVGGFEALFAEENLPRPSAKPETKKAEVSSPADSASTVTVRRGETLWMIARQTYGNGRKYTLIFKANKEQIRNPNRIYPGQVLTVPR